MDLREYLKNILQSEISRGDSSLALQLLDTLNDRLLERFAPTNIKESIELKQANIGKPLFVIKIVTDDGVFYKQNLDFIISDTEFGKILNQDNGEFKNVQVISHYETIIEGVSIANYYLYDKSFDNASLIDFRVINPLAVQSYNFVSKVTIDISGSTLEDLSKEEIDKTIRKAINPVWFYSEVFNDKMDISIETIK